MTQAERHYIESIYPPDFVRRLANLACSLANDEQVTAKFALDVWSQWAPPSAMPLELFAPERFGRIH